MKYFQIFKSSVRRPVGQRVIELNEHYFKQFVYNELEFSDDNKDFEQAMQEATTLNGFDCGDFDLYAVDDNFPFYPGVEIGISIDSRPYYNIWIQGEYLDSKFDTLEDLKRYFVDNPLYHIDINYWKQGSGYSHSTTVDNFYGSILTEDELLEAYAAYGWAGCEIEQLDENCNRVAFAEIEEDTPYALRIEDI